MSYYSFISVSKDDNFPQESSREPLSKKRRLSGPSEGEDHRDSQQIQQEPQDDKVQRKLQLIEPLPQPQRKAYQRGISCDTAVKLMDSFRIPKKQTTSPSTSRHKRYVHSFYWFLLKLEHVIFHGK